MLNVERVFTAEGLIEQQMMNVNWFLHEEKSFTVICRYNNVSSAYRLKHGAESLLISSKARFIKKTDGM